MTPVRIGIERGAVIVNDATLSYAASDIVCIDVDCTTKRPTYDGTITGGGEPPAVCLGADAGTLFTDEEWSRVDTTVVTFKDYRGWRVFAAEVSKYTVHVVLVKPAKEAK